MLSKRLGSLVQIRSILLAVAILALTLLFSLPEWIRAAAQSGLGRRSLLPLESSLLIETHLYMKSSWISLNLKHLPNWGGAIEPLGDNLLGGDAERTA